MNEFNLDIDDIEKRMSGAIASLKNDFLSLSGQEEHRLQCLSL